MADVTNPMFNRAAAEKLRSPDDLDKYVRVTNPSVWIVLVACVALLAGLLAWGMFGAVTTSVSATGVSVNGNAMCFLSAEDVVKVNEGDAAFVGGEQMTVSEVSVIPLSRDEADKILGNDYLVSTLVHGDWAYQVIFSGDTTGIVEGVPLAVRITTDSVTPINLIIRSNA